MDISLVIPAHNEEAYIGGCLDAAMKNSGGRFREILVVDNASTDRTADVARVRRGVRVVYEARRGLTCARQRGLEASSGELLAYIDADTHLPPQWFETAEAVFSNDLAAVSLSGPARYWDGTAFQNLCMALLWRLSAPLMYRSVGYMVYGANFIAKRSALAAAGGFDRSLDFYGEDTDIARRLSRFGKTVFRMDFFIYTSARRLRAEGIFRTNLRYAVNYLWPVLFKRPFHTTHRDVRTIS